MEEEEDVVVVLEQSRLPSVNASVAARGITAQIRPCSGSYTVSAVPMMKVPPTQVAAWIPADVAHQTISPRDELSFYLN